MPANSSDPHAVRPAKLTGLWPLFIPLLLGIGPAQCSATLTAFAPAGRHGLGGASASTPVGFVIGLIAGLAVATMAAKLVGRWFGPIPSKRDQLALPAGERALGIALGLLGIIGFFVPGVFLLELTKRGFGPGAALFLPATLAIALAWPRPRLDAPS